MSKIVLITGCSSGLGRALAATAAHKGCTVAATARKVEDLADLRERYPSLIHPLTLDLRVPESIRGAVLAIHQSYGRIDIVINNAGQGLLGPLEELSEEQIQENMDVNLFGPLHVLRAVVPILRAQRSGVIVNISALAAFSNHPGFTIYGGAKAAMEAICDGLSAELKPFRIKVINVEPGPFRTDFIRRSLVRTTHGFDGYAATVGKFGELLNSIDGKQAGDPAKAAEAIFQAIASAETPNRLILGKFAYKAARQRLSQIARELDEWEAVGATTDFG